MTGRRGKTGLKGASLSEEYPDVKGDGGLDAVTAEADAARGAADASVRFAEARRAMLDVETPRDGSAAAERMAEAAKRVRGFAWDPGPLGLPPNCPVRPLGKRGSQLYLLNPIDELVEVGAAKLGQQSELDALFTPDGGYLWAFYSNLSKQGELRIKYEDIRRDLIQACGRMAYQAGVFDPARRVRGRGAWTTDDGVLVLHLGDRLWVGGEEKPLGEVEGFVYPREESLPAPIIPEPGEGRGAGRRLLQMLKTWRFDRGPQQDDIDARLALGWMVCVLMGAALAWRPQIFVIGDAGTGKSTLQGLFRKVLGGRLMAAADVTSAGIYQTLGRASIGVSVDEFENEGDDASESQAAKVLKLARLASSGDKVVRGGQDGVPSNYEAQGVFGFSGINMPALKPAEQSRMAVLMLHPQLDAKAQAPKLSDAEGLELGQRLLGRVIDRWHEWPEVLEAWRGVLLAGNQSSRTADQFGTLLAAAHLACHDGPPLPDQVAAASEHLSRYRLAETANIKPNWERCLDWLLAAQPDAWRGLKMRSVGEFLEAVIKNQLHAEADETQLQVARQRLAQAGLGLVMRPNETLELTHHLAVPAAHQQVGALFRGSTWGTRAGAPEGTWATALRLAPGNLAEPGVAKIDGRSTRVTLLRLDRIISAAEPQEEPGAEG